MTKKGIESMNPPAMTENQIKNEKAGIDIAFSQTDHFPDLQVVDDDDELLFDDDGQNDPEVPAEKTFLQPFELPPELKRFNKTMFREFTEHEFADKAKAMAALDNEIDLLEMDLKRETAKRKEGIAEVESRRRVLSAAVSAKGAETVVECGKTIDFEKSKATIFVVETWEVLETRQLAEYEIQTELKLRDNSIKESVLANGGKLIDGKWPADKPIGAVETHDAADVDAEAGLEKARKESDAKAAKKSKGKKGKG